MLLLLPANSYVLFSLLCLASANGRATARKSFKTNVPQTYRVLLFQRCSELQSVPRTSDGAVKSCTNEPNGPKVSSIYSRRMSYIKFATYFGADYWYLKFSSVRKCQLKYRGLAKYRTWVFQVLEIS